MCKEQSGEEKKCSSEYNIHPIQKLSASVQTLPPPVVELYRLELLSVLTKKARREQNNSQVKLRELSAKRDMNKANIIHFSNKCLKEKIGRKKPSIFQPSPQQFLQVYFLLMDHSKHWHRA